MTNSTDILPHVTEYEDEEGKIFAAEIELDGETLTWYGYTMNEIIEQYVEIMEEYLG